jgi:hypothetical protein
MIVTFDLTTSNTVFNPLSAQGSWIQHRFGKRNYPSAELPIEKVLEVIAETEASEYFLESNYGDALCYSHIDELLESDAAFIIRSYCNIDNDALFHKIKEKNYTVAVNLADIDEHNSSVFLHSDWSVISKNLMTLGSCAYITFWLYEHNQSQLKTLADFCYKYGNNLQVVPGVALHQDHSSIIDERGSWLYDVVSSSTISTDGFISGNDLVVLSEKADKLANEYTKVSQSLFCYSTLRTFLKEQKGRSILNYPIVPIFEPFQIEKPFSEIAITVTGHVLPSKTLAETFSHTLCDDWKLDRNDLVDSYRGEIIKQLNSITLLNLDRVNLHNNTFTDVLSYLRDSNI